MCGVKGAAPLSDAVLDRTRILSLHAVRLLTLIANVEYELVRLDYAFVYALHVSAIS